MPERHALASWLAAALICCGCDGLRFTPIDAAAPPDGGGAATDAAAAPDAAAVPDAAMAPDAATVPDAAARTTLSFAPPVLYGGSRGPRQVAVADFDGDGLLDVAVAGEPLAILRGNGDGTLRLAGTYATQYNPWSITVADFNQDGRPDIAVGHNTPDTIGIYLNQGGGAFSPEVALSTGSVYPFFVAAGDFNRDGRADVIGHVGEGAFLAGRGDGGFLPATRFGSPIWTYDATTVDVDGDGQLDLLIGRYDQGAIAVCTGNGDGTFKPARAYPTAFGMFGVAYGDLDGDGQLDLVGVNFETSGVPSMAWSLLGDGHGRFRGPIATALPVRTEARGAALGDLLGRGRLDLITQDYTKRQAVVLLGNGDGTYQPAQMFPSGQGPFYTVVADLNRDGLPDLVVADVNGGGVEILINTSR